MKSYSVNLHLHSCLSPCGDDDMTPATIAGLSKLADLDVVALTDHNTCGNCAAFCRACEAYGLLGIPGMELCTSEEVHVICLFPNLQAADAFQALVYDRLLPLENEPEIMGRQLLMNEEDEVLGEESRMLSGASTIGLYEIPGLVAPLGGVAFPAHVDRPSLSLLSNLGLWDPDAGFPLAELSMSASDDFLSSRRDMGGIPTLRATDAHNLGQIANPSQSAELESLSPDAVIRWLQAGCPGL